MTVMAAAFRIKRSVATYKSVRGPVALVDTIHNPCPALVGKLNTPKNVQTGIWPFPFCGACGTKRTERNTKWDASARIWRPPNA